MASNNWPRPHEGDFTIPNFQFKDGQSLPKLRLHYRTLGRLQKDAQGRATNAILIMHGTTGSGANFFTPAFAGNLFNAGQPLSAEEYFLILPDGIGHGGSSKPSDGLRARFPRYCYGDMVRAQHALVSEHLGVNHLRLVCGTSMGGMHTWVWGTQYPTFMDALFPLASLPAQIAGRNRMWRKHAIDSIRLDPGFEGGEYTHPPPGFRSALHVLAWMASSPLKWQQAAPDRASADEFIDALIERSMKSQDANDFAYAFDASWDYDPRPLLGAIEVPLTAVNSADDQVNPPELRILETEMGKVKQGKAVVLPITDKTAGHGTHSIAECWVEHLVELLRRSERGEKARL